MAKAAWRVLALAALLGSVAPVASAQVVIGGSGQPDVVVNWSVLDRLGQQPSLADMLKDELPNRQPQTAVAPPARKSATAAAPQGLVFKPFKPVAKVKPVTVAGDSKPVKAAKPAKAATAVAAAPVEPTPAPEAKHAEPAPAPVVKATAKPALPAKPQIADSVPMPAGPQVNLPAVKAEPAKPAVPAKPMDIVKPVPVEPATPVEVAKVVEPVKPVEALKPVVAAKPAPVPVEPLAPTIVAEPKPLLAPVPPPVPVMPPQVASLPSAEPPSALGSDTISLLFATDDAKVSDRARGELATLVKRMQKDEDLNLQLLSYASGDEASTSKARRLSLSRALEVRKYLLDKGIRSTRIEVRALGNKLDGRGPADRVDAVLVGR